MCKDIPLRAEPLLKLFIEKATAKFKDRVASIFKFGSLGSHGGFSVCSDVDVVLMLDEIKESDYEDVQVLCDELKASGLEYADRLSVFWSSYNKDTFAKGVGRFPPLDRLDLIRYGVLLIGSDRRAVLPEPSQKDLILDSAGFISSFMLTDEKIDQLTKHPEKIAAEGARYFTKFVLFPVRLVFTLDNPSVIGSNQDAVDHYNRVWAANVPEAAELINFAFKLRNSPAKEPVKIGANSLKQALPALYNYCISRYHEAVLLLGHADLASKLKRENKHLCALTLKGN